MHIELANKIDREMWYFDKKSTSVWPVYAIAESITGDTIDTNCGQRLRTSTKSHAIFNYWYFARLAQKEARKEFDEEYYSILKDKGARRIRLESS